MAEINQLYYDEVQVGDDVTPLVKGPMTTSHIMRWSSAMEKLAPNSLRQAVCNRT